MYNEGEDLNRRLSEISFTDSRVLAQTQEAPQTQAPQAPAEEASQAPAAVPPPLLSPPLPAKKSKTKTKTSRRALKAEIKKLQGIISTITKKPDPPHQGWSGHRIRWKGGRVKSNRVKTHKNKQKKSRKFRR